MSEDNMEQTLRVGLSEVAARLEEGYPARDPHTFREDLLRMARARHSRLVGARVAVLVLLAGASVGLYAAGRPDSTRGIRIRPPGTEGSYSNGTKPAGPACLLPYASKSPPAGIQVQLEASRLSMTEPESIRFTVRVVNSGPEPIGFTRGSSVFDLWIEGSEGVIWRRLTSGSTLIAHDDALKAGEERVRTVDWKQENCLGERGLPPGRYVARAQWLLSDVDANGRDVGWPSNEVEFALP